VECDADLDLADFASLQECFGRLPLPPACAIFDFDFDEDVDVNDFADWMERMTGPNS